MIGVELPGRFALTWRFDQKRAPLQSFRGQTEPYRRRNSVSCVQVRISGGSPTTWEPGATGDGMTLVPIEGAWPPPLRR